MTHIQVALPITVPKGKYCETKKVGCTYFSPENDYYKNYFRLELGTDMSKDSKGILKPENCLALEEI